MSEEKYYIISDIAEANGKSRMCMLNMIRTRDGIKYAKKVNVMAKCRITSTYAFPHSMLVNMGFIIPGKEFCEAKPQEKLTLEEMKALHPLVTDYNFFKLSYFPEVRLECDLNASKKELT